MKRIVININGEKVVGGMVVPEILILTETSDPQKPVSVEELAGCLRVAYMYASDAFMKMHRCSHGVKCDAHIMHEESREALVEVEAHVRMENAQTQVPFTKGCKECPKQAHFYQADSENHIEVYRCPDGHLSEYPEVK